MARLAALDLYEKNPYTLLSSCEKWGINKTHSPSPAVLKVFLRAW